MVGMLKPEVEETVWARPRCKHTFKASKLGTHRRLHGHATGKRRGAPASACCANDVVVHDGEMASLRRFDDRRAGGPGGLECGILLDGFNDVKEGDVLEFFQTKQVEQTLE